MRRRRRYPVIVGMLVGSAIAFLADYPPARDAFRAWLDEARRELDERRQYARAIERTLASIRRLPETEEPSP